MSRRAGASAAGSTTPPPRPAWSCLSSRGAGALIGLAYAAFGPSGAAGAARKGGAIVSMVLDEERLCLYTLGARGFICTYDLAPLPGGGNSSTGGPPPGDRDGSAAVAGTAAAQDRPLLPRAWPGLVRRPGGRGP